MFIFKKKGVARASREQTGPGNNRTCSALLPDWRHLGRRPGAGTSTAPCTEVVIVTFRSQQQPQHPQQLHGFALYFNSEHLSSVVKWITV